MSYDLRPGRRMLDLTTAPIEVHNFAKLILHNVAKDRVATMTLAACVLVPAVVEMLAIRNIIDGAVAQVSHIRRRIPARNANIVSYLLLACGVVVPVRLTVRDSRTQKLLR